MHNTCWTLTPAVAFLTDPEALQKCTPSTLLAKITWKKNPVLASGMSVYCQTAHPSEDEVGQKTVRTLVNSVVCLGGSSCFLAGVPESLPSLAAMPHVLKAGCRLLENKHATYLLGGCLTLLDQVCSI